MRRGFFFFGGVLSPGSLPSSGDGIFFSAEPSLSIEGTDIGAGVEHLPRHMINFLARIDADIAFDRTGRQAMRNGEINQRKTRWFKRLDQLCFLLVR